MIHKKNIQISLRLKTVIFFSLDHIMFDKISNSDKKDPQIFIQFENLNIPNV